MRPIITLLRCGARPPCGRGLRCSNGRRRLCAIRLRIFTYHIIGVGWIDVTGDTRASDPFASDEILMEIRHGTILNKAAFGEIAEEVTGTEGPGRTVGRMLHAIN